MPASFLKHIILGLLLPLAFITSAQEVNFGFDPDLTSWAGQYSFNPLENNIVVKAAGMELLEEDDETADLIGDLLDYAFTFTGTHYRRGGKTPAGFDCSGFTGYVFSQFGIKLNSDSRSQFLQGEPIDDTFNVQPGDLVFFGGRGAGTTIGHVGIATEIDYETGVITFLHSATSGGVRTDNTADPYYSHRYKGARRVIL